MKAAVTFLGAVAMVLSMALVASADSDSERFELACTVHKDGNLLSEQRKNLGKNNGTMTVDAGNISIEMSRQSQISIVATDKTDKKSIVAIGSQKASLFIINEQTQTQELGVECHLK